LERLALFDQTFDLGHGFTCLRFHDAPIDRPFADLDRP
jgi:hypothetical protein